jgi:hypothetical protein
MLGKFQGRGEAKLAKHVHDVVVDGLGYAHDANLEATACDFIVDSVRAALGAVATYAKQDVDVRTLQEIDNDRGLLGPRLEPRIVPP